MFKRIMAAIDGSPQASRAIDYAADLANKYGAELILLHATGSTESVHVPAELRDVLRIAHLKATRTDILRRVAEDLLQQGEMRARERGATNVRILIAESPHVADSIVNYAKGEGVDLIVMGRRGLGSVASALLGSISQKVSHYCQCACMTVM
jgi:nucleotide-binding universal stress UspA family protein